MRISVGWLRELVPTNWSDDQIAERLTAAGLEVEGRETRALGPKVDVVSARVQSRTKVEGSDHLSVCQIEEGNGLVSQVVCGADNYAAGDVVALARVGAVLPDGKAIARAKLRGHESAGMLCSARELGLSDDHSGLLILPRDTPLGLPLGPLLGLPDTVLELNVTPNRPDALSHLGIARELAALQGAASLAAGSLGAAPVPAGNSVRIEAGDRCPRYLAQRIEGVRVAPSPLRFQERLRACGVRPINNVVDATNLALLELGHPLHAFDRDRLAEDRIVVRLARPGETLVTLDGKERALDASDLIIADAARPIALAGVMGGAMSEVTPGTTRLLLESAMFDPVSVRRTARRHALHTEASHRFERGADEQMAARALARCAQLIVELAGGKLDGPPLEVFPQPLAPVRVWVRPARVSAVLGSEIPAAEVHARLRSLGLEPGEGDEQRRRWTIPSWRRDLTREIDCIEEVARLRGFDAIPVESPRVSAGPAARPDAESLATRSGRSALAAAGFDEVVNYSFVAEKDLRALAPDLPADALIRVANPFTPEQGAMRTTLLAGLLRNLGHNLARGNGDLRFYELGRIYRGDARGARGEGPLSTPAHEPRRLAFVALGRRDPRGWEGADDSYDFFDAKAALEELFVALGVADAAFVPAAGSASLHPRSACTVQVGDRAIGSFGEIHPRAAQTFDLPRAVILGELDWDALLAAARPVRLARAIPRFPATSRDLAFVVDAGTSAAAMLEAIRGADAHGLLEHVVLFDVYRGAPIPDGKKSLAFSLTLRAPDRTLTDAEADALSAAIALEAGRRTGAHIRA